jgi:histidinol phosphatase-like enzyme
LASSVLIGDNITDIAAGRSAGIGTNILLTQSRPAPFSEDDVQCHVAESLDEIRRRFFAQLAGDQS